MKKILSIAIVVLMALGLMIPVFASAATADPGQTLFVNCADGRRLNVRQAPNKNAKMLYQVECGTKLEVLAGGEAAKGWIYVKANGKAAGYDALAFGCPAMGAEELEDSEFEPMFADVEGALAGKKVALFGSYGWGDGQWMRDWEDRCKSAGISLAAESVLANETPGDAEIANCKALGAALA